MGYIYSFFSYNLTMKSKIMFYYNLGEIELTKQDDMYFFRYQGDCYSFEKIKNLMYIKFLLKILNNIQYIKAYKLVLNIYQDEFTNIDGTWYALFLRNYTQTDLFHEILQPILIPNNISSKIDVELWGFLWERKIDYYEYQISHLTNIYPLIEESFYYYIGMAENAVSYLKYNFSPSISLPLYLCHHRIVPDEYFHPLNMVVDYYARDVAEYIKYLFFSNNYYNFPFFSFFQTLHFSYNDFVLLYARLLFPTFYFDVYDDIINNKLRETNIRNIIMRVDEYNDFLQYLFQLIEKIAKIPEILWLKKEML